MIDLGAVHSNAILLKTVAFFVALSVTTLLSGGSVIFLVRMPHISSYFCRKSFSIEDSSEDAKDELWSSPDTSKDSSDTSMPSPSSLLFCDFGLS